MCTIQRKIFSNYCFKQCPNIFAYKILRFVMVFITLRNNINISLKIKRKICELYQYIKDGNIAW